MFLTNLHFCSLEEKLSFLMPSFDLANTSVNLVIKVESTYNVGALSRLFSFDYRPNPELEDIEPRTSILRY